MKKFDGRSQKVFVTDSNEFNFGSVLIAKDKPSKGPGVYSQDICLRNVSLFPAEVTLPQCSSRQATLADEYWSVSVRI